MFYKVANQFRQPRGLLGRLISNLMIRGNKHAYNQLLADMKIQPGDKLLEIGFGPGFGIKSIFQKYQPGLVYGVDFSGLMFEKASAMNKQLVSEGKVKLFFGDFLTIPLTEKDFDSIFCLNVVYFWDDLYVPFSRIYSLLSNSGRFHFYMSSKQDLDRLKFTDDDVFNKHSIERVEEELKRAGFTSVKHYYKLGYFVEAVK